MTTGRDVLGELVQAAGRRTVPEREDYQYVLDAAMAAWRQKLRARRRRRWALALAASVAASAVGVATFLHWMPRKSAALIATTTVLHGSVAIRPPGRDTWLPLQPETRIAAGSQLRTGALAGLALVLDGGATARLDKQSELAIESGGVIRLIAGAVYADSGPAGTAGGLRIETPMGTVSDVGTIFQIRVAPGSLRIRVREGLVRLEAANTSTHLQAKAGEELDLDEHGAVSRQPFSPIDPAWAWAEALAEAPDLDACPLLQFLEWVARETGRRVEFLGPEVEAQAREVILHGNTHDLTPLQALDLMLSTTDLEYVLSPEETILIRRRQDQDR
jgi:ferric-dicitrate binding protein FerR (iron transport regulator)